MSGDVAATIEAIPYYLLSGCGNSFVVLEDNLHTVSDWSCRVTSLLAKGSGFGTDGMMIVRSGDQQSGFDVVMLNPDGTLSGMCGNGLRCVIRFLALTQRISSKVEEARVTIRIGERSVECEYTSAGARSSINMGSAVWDHELVPHAFGATMLNATLDLDGESRQWSAVSMGNPHVVTFVDDLALIPLEVIGPKVEHHKIFPARTNVEYCKQLSPDTIQVKVWERGAGATMACGSGACAVGAVASKLGLIKGPVVIQMPGGNLEVEIDSITGNVKLSGPVEDLGRGVINWGRI